MASKSHLAVAAPSQISLTDQVLSSRISLPPDPCVSYTRFIPDPNSPLKPHQSIELARRNVLLRNAAAILLDSMLSSIHIGTSSFMYVFSISAQDRIEDATSALATLRFDGLTADATSSFSLKDLYPCSPGCSILLKPCPNCQDRSSSSSSSSSTLLPRRPLRVVYSHFLEALRIRLLDDIAQASSQNVPNRPSRVVKRLKGGFLLGSPSSTSEWGSTWEYRALSRPLLYCQIQVHLSNAPKASTPSLIIHPLLLPTPFLPLAHLLPSPRGTPITLLPHGTPAFFLTHYAGPTSAVKKQFQESLQGLGVSGWETLSSSAGFVPNSIASKPEFIVAWLNVENKQGEDKGIILIYPTALCLSFTPSTLSGIPARLPLDYIPELPAPLQPSPQVAAAAPPFQAGVSSSVSGAGPSTTSRAPSPSTARFPSTPPSQLHPRPVLPSSPTSDSVRAFRALTLSKSKDIRHVAYEVGGYVDAVARERERERERLKRERENGPSSSPKLARTAVTTPAAPTPTTSVTTDAPAPLLTTAFPASSQPVAGPGQQQPHHTTPAQNFYPSPPQTNALIAPLQPGQTSPSTEAPSALPTIASTTTLQTASPTPTLPTPTSTAASALSQPVPGTFDTFGSSDAAWAIQPQPYLEMNMDMDMDFDMGMSMDMGFDMNSGSRDGVYGGGTSTGMDFDDSAFTDDDFSFFDRPSAPTQGLPLSLPLAPPPLDMSRSPAAPSAMHSNAGTSGLTPAQNSMNINASSPLFVDALHISGLGPSQQTSTPHSHTFHSSSPWVSTTLSEGFTPRFTDTDSSAVLPDLLPPSPGPTPPSHSAPATPTVHLESDPAIRRPSTGASTFHPIPFAAYHRTLDGKYAMGKFSLPSPPDEEDRTEPLNLNWQLGASYFPKSLTAGVGPAAMSNNGWRFKYMAATDPRIGVVRKLIGVKRKMTFEQGGREASSLVVGGTPRMSPSWIREHEDWEKYTRADAASSGLDDADNDDGKSDAESDYDMDDPREESESPIISRPSTPSPGYLPLGPTLLHTQFQHCELLPLSTPLRQPGAAVAPTNITTATHIASVPTPVSPAAMMGASSEKSKSLEAAAFTVATEVVENPPWAEAWRASTLAGSKQPADVWLADVRTIVRLLEAVPGLDGPLDLETLFGFSPQETIPTKSERTSSSSKPLQMLESPMISVAKGDAIIQILPTALRFWEKLGLGPRGGVKNGTTFVLFEDDGDQRQQQVEGWLAIIAATYEGKHFGTLVPGKSPLCSRDGLFPLRFDSSFPSLVASLPASETSIVFFIVTPIPTLTLASPILRQVFSAVKKAAKTYSEAQIHFQFVPEQLIHGNLGNPAADFSDLEVVCGSVYNRMLVPVDRVMSRRFFEHGVRVRKYFQDPLLTLARPTHNNVSFVRAPHASLDVMDRNTFLHVGYQVSPCGKWILAACVDQRGEAHDLGVWLTQTPGEGESEEVSEDMFLVKKIWGFALQFAKKANVEWRIAFARLGTMGESELDAWVSLIEANSRGLRISSVTLLSVELETPWTFCSSRPQLKTTPTKAHNPTRTSSTPRSHPQNIFTDISNTFYALSPHSALPQSLPPTLTDLGLTLSIILEPPYPPTSTPLEQEQRHPPAPLALPHPLALLPCSSTSLICLPVTPSPTAITMLHIHLLHNIRPPPSITTPEDIPSLHAAITHNFHELAVLAGTRWRLSVSPALPFHLAAVEAMRIALDRDQYGMDTADSA